MSVSSKYKIRAFAGLPMCAVLILGLCLPALAASTLDRSAKGSLIIQPTYGGEVISGGTFDIYYVASLNDSSVIGYTLKEGFNNAALIDGLNINKVKTSSELEKAAVTLSKYISNIDSENIITHNRTVDGDKVTGLALGAYLVVQKSISSPYTVSSPFLIFLPMGTSTEWLYEVTAMPKLGYSPPSPETTSVSVIKVWNDSGFESQRPTSVSVALLQNGIQYGDAVTLSESNSWSYSWNELSQGYTWSVTELTKDNRYVTSIVGNGNSFTITNTRTEDVPENITVSVLKQWSGDTESNRPVSINATLYRDGAVYDTVQLNAENGWAHNWSGLDEGHVWSVSEVSVPDGYESSISQNGYNFVITNTLKNNPPTTQPPTTEPTETNPNTQPTVVTTGDSLIDGDNDGDIPLVPANGEDSTITTTQPTGSDETEEELVDVEDPELPLVAPQTGMLQWPIPVLVILGITFILFGILPGKKAD